MKTITLILISFLFLTGASEGKEVSYLQDRGGVRYEINSETPFTGKLVEKYWSGQKWHEGSYIDGKKDGLHTSWYWNGQKKVEGNWKDGKADGVATHWHENGQKNNLATLIAENERVLALVEKYKAEWGKNGQKKVEGSNKDSKANTEQIKLATAISTNVPLVKIPPRYPIRAALDRIEGWVKIEFTITKEGTVKDAVVVQAHPSKIFNRSALQAIRRWKFKARIIDGEAFEQRAMQELKFKLSK